MKMLDDIIDGAVDDSTSLASLLRKCLVVADKLKNRKLKKWVLSELNGYGEGDELPEYRILSINAVGMVLAIHQVIKNQPIPAMLMDEEHRHWATTARLAQPISGYETLADKGSDTLAIAWPADLVSYYQERFFEGRVLNRAHQVIPVSSLKGIIDKVRSRLLLFALELRNELGETEPTPQNPPPAVVENQVTQIIFGQINVSGGGTISGDINQAVNQTIIKGDFASVSNVLSEIGIPQNRHAGLKAAIEEDGKKIGPKTDGWIKSTLKSLGKGVLKVGETMATEVITGAVTAYLG